MLESLQFSIFEGCVPRRLDSTVGQDEINRGSLPTVLNAITINYRAFYRNLVISGNPGRRLLITGVLLYTTFIVTTYAPDPQ